MIIVRLGGVFVLLFGLLQVVWGLYLFFQEVETQRFFNLVTIGLVLIGVGNVVAGIGMVKARTTAAIATVGLGALSLFYVLKSMPINSPLGFILSICWITTIVTALRHAFGKAQ